MTESSSAMRSGQTYVVGYRCTLCDSTHDRKEAVLSHISDTSDPDHRQVDTPLSFVAPVSHELTPTAFESLYVINKFAKRFADRASVEYNNNRKGEATDLSNKKKALYTTKRKFLERTVDFAHKIAIHTIDGTDFYCLYYSDEAGTEWSFHAPVNTFDAEIDSADIVETDHLTNYERTTRVAESDRTLQESLVHLNESHGLNANRYVPMTSMHATDSFKPPFTGWDFL